MNKHFENQIWRDVLRYSRIKRAIRKSPYFDRQILVDVIAGYAVILGIAAVIFTIIFLTIN